MMFLGIAEDAIVFIEAESAHDAKAFALVELGATDKRPVLVERIREDSGAADVALEWRGSDAGITGGRQLAVFRHGHGKQSKWRTVDADRAWWDRVQRREKRPPAPSPCPLPAGPIAGETCTVMVDATVVTGPAKIMFEYAVERSEAEQRARSSNEARAAVDVQYRHLLDNLTATQERGKTLLEEARLARRERDAWYEAFIRQIGISRLPPTMAEAIRSLLTERGRQDTKWGPIGAPNAPQDALAIPFGTGGELSRELADEARAACDVAFKDGHGTWADLLKEKLAEALAETDPVTLRVKLLQLGAVCVKLVEILDWKAAPRG